jgi:DNA-binding transcriptional regulator YiaG
MSQDDVATLLWVEVHTVIAWEHGVVPLRKQNPKLIEFLGYDPYEVAVTT